MKYALTSSQVRYDISFVNETYIVGVFKELSLACRLHLKYAWLHGNYGHVCEAYVKHA